MRRKFHCLVCSQIVEPSLVHIACRRTCGNPECQAIYQKRYSAQIERHLQRKRIEHLRQQGIDLVTCALCDQQFEMIHHCHLRTHGLSLKEYKLLYPNLPTLNSRMKQTRGEGALNQSQYLNYSGKQPDQRLYEFLTGCLLGDGHLEKRPGKRNARYAEGGSNQEYLKWKHEFLSQYLPCSFKEKISSPHILTGREYRGWWIKTKVHPLLTELHSQWYSDRKFVSQDIILKYLSEFALIVWFCDDGCSSNGIRFYTMAFSIDEVTLLKRLLESRFGFQASILTNQKNQPFIRLGGDSKQKLAKIVSSFSIPGMKYKLDL